MKTCGKCTESKPPSEFYAHSTTADRLGVNCKECHKATVRANRQKRQDYYRNYDKTRAAAPHRIAANTESTRRWRAKDPRRAAAHDAVARALRQGQLVKCPCERCGSERSYAHHEDYDQPLVVKWLCQPDHRVRHKEMAVAGINP